MATPAISDLIQRIDDLQQRLAILERRFEAGASPPARQEPVPVAPAQHLGLAVVEIPQNTLLVVGRALLGVAGAYVLRALTDVGWMPNWLGVAVGLLYALVWLVGAARLPVSPKFPVLVTSATCVVLMAPLIWEASERFKVMSPWTTAAVLTASSVTGLALSWSKRSTIVAPLVSVVSSVLAASLLMVTHDLVPFTMALLAIAGAAEFAAWRGRPAGPRWLFALLAGLAVLLSSWLMSGGRPLPEGYAPVRARDLLIAQALFVLIYVSTAVVETVARRLTLTFQEMALTAIALLIGIGGMVSVFRSNSAGMLALGVVALIAGLACYAVSFLLFDRSNTWNFRAWATFGLFLVLVGAFLPLSGSGYWLLWCGCAVACCWIGMATGRPTLGLHGAVYLLLAAAFSGAIGQPLSQMFGAGSAPLQWLVSAGVPAAALISWIAVSRTHPGDGAHWRNPASSLALAAAIAWILAGAAAHLLVEAWRSIAGAGAGNIPSDTLATVVLTGLAISVGLAEARWHRREFVWLVYGLMALGAWKLVTRDLMNERNLTLVVSLLCYGGALMLLPGILRRAPLPKTVKPGGIGADA